jgi:hypothetical protein
MRFIELSKIVGRDVADEEGEEGQETDRTVPVRVQVEAIRCFYPRKGDRVGTRLTFTDGGGFAVSEEFPHVGRLVTGGPVFVG